MPDPRGRRARAAVAKRPRLTANPTTAWRSRSDRRVPSLLVWVVHLEARVRELVHGALVQTLHHHLWSAGRSAGQSVGQSVVFFGASSWLMVETEVRGRVERRRGWSTRLAGVRLVLLDSRVERAESHIIMHVEAEERARLAARTLDDQLVEGGRVRQDQVLLDVHQVAR